jgi:hypothetical protein
MDDLGEGLHGHPVKYRDTTETTELESELSECRVDPNDPHSLPRHPKEFALFPMACYVCLAKRLDQ